MATGEHVGVTRPRAESQPPTSLPGGSSFGLSLQVLKYSATGCRGHHFSQHDALKDGTGESKGSRRRQGR